MSDTLVFFGWERSGVYDLVPSDTLVTEDGIARLEAVIPTTIQTRDDSSPASSVEVRLPITGPGDIQRLDASSFFAPFPPPFSTDHETSKCPMIRVQPADLPWRYTPERAVNGQLRPWFVLLVGEEEELKEVGADKIEISSKVHAQHDLTYSSQWVHLQSLGDPDNAQYTARLLNTRSLDPHTRYIAVIVPSFTPAGQPAWTKDTDSAVTLPYFMKWSFMTGEGGDFSTLAERLRPQPPNPALGLAKVHHPYTNETLSIRGAMAPIASQDDPVPTKITQHMETLLEPQKDPIGRPIVTAPVYGAQWHDDPSSTPWGQAANIDPRHRGVAGLGVEAAISLESLVVRVVQEQVGPLHEVSNKTRSLTMGLLATQSLWDRYLPRTAGEKLRLFGPALERVMTPKGSVLDVITDETRPLDKALFTSAARRILRHGPQRTALAADGAHNAHDVFTVANTCHPQKDHGQGPTAQALGQLLEVDLTTILTTALPNDDPYAALAHVMNAKELGVLRSQLGEDVSPMEVLFASEYSPFPSAGPHFSSAQATHGASTPEPLSTGTSYERPDPVEFQDALMNFLASFEQGTPPACEPVDLTALTTSLEQAFSPHGEDAWMRQRVLGVLDNFQGRPEDPVEFCTSVAFPAWRFLRETAPDWLLPGASQIKRDSIYAVASNPVFIAAFLLGMNERTLFELRWRNLPISANCTPLRKFWGSIAPDAQSTVDDIRGVHNWVGPLGSADNQPDGAPQEQLVLVFKTDLFRRYPDALVYAIPEGEDADNESVRVWPVFQGRVQEDLTFFGFPFTPAQGLTHTMVLEQLPEGLAFRNDSDDKRSPMDGGAFAAERMNVPVRILVPGADLIPTEVT